MTVKKEKNLGRCEGFGRRARDEFAEGI